MPINKNEITKEMIAKAMQCETADELIALANSEGIELKRIWLNWKILNWIQMFYRRSLAVVYMIL